MALPKTQSTINKLERQLGNLAATYRNASSLKERNKAKAEYHRVMQKLLDSGWSDVLDAEATLPTAEMPDTYLKRHPVRSKGWKPSVSAMKQEAARQKHLEK